MNPKTCAFAELLIDLEGTTGGQGGDLGLIWDGDHFGRTVNTAGRIGDCAAEEVLASGWLTSLAVERSFGRWVSRLSGRNRHQSHTPRDELADPGPGGQPCGGVNDTAL